MQTTRPPNAYLIFVAEISKRNKKSGISLTKKELSFLWEVYPDKQRYINLAKKKRQEYEEYLENHHKIMRQRQLRTYALKERIRNAAVDRVQINPQFCAFDVIAETVDPKLFFQ